MRRRKHYSGQSRKAGLSPGTLVHTGPMPEGGVITISRLAYSPVDFNEEHFENSDRYHPLKEVSGITWTNVEGLHDLALISRIGECYGLHPLVLEDIVNTSQRPKIEDYGDYIFIVARMIRFRNDNTIETEQVGLILGKNYVLSFQEGISGDVFEPVRENIRKNRGKIRVMASDYLVYTLIDAIVDSYFTVLEGMGDLVENLEEALTERPSQQILKKVLDLRREAIFLRKGVWPLREVTVVLERGDSNLISDASRVYFRDVYDHTIQVIDGIETFRDLLAGMLDLYLSSMSNRTNEIMKFLTVVGTIFMPLTFIVGVYGMNFKYMPELEWRYGYYALWMIMVTLTAAMIIYFKKHRWL